MNKKMSRRDFLKLAGVTSAGLALSACGVKATESPEPILTPMPTATTAHTPVPTATSEPMSIFGEYQIPEKLVLSSITQFVYALNLANIQLSVEQIKSGIKVQKINGDSALCAITSNTGNAISDGLPLLIANQGQNSELKKAEWKKVTFANSGKTVELPVGTTVYPVEPTVYGDGMFTVGSYADALKQFGVVWDEDDYRDDFRKKYGDYAPDNLRRAAISGGDGGMIMMPANLIYHQHISPDILNISSSDIEIKNKVGESIRGTIHYALSKLGGAKPAFIILNNEALFAYLQNDGNLVRGWDKGKGNKNPYYSAFGRDLLFETLKMAYEEAKKLKFTPGKDVYFLNGMYLGYQPSPQLDWYVEQTDRAKELLATELKINPEDVAYGIASQVHVSAKNTTRQPYGLSPDGHGEIPDKNKLVEAITLAKGKYDGKVWITEVGVRDADADQTVAILTDIIQASKEGGAEGVVLWNALKDSTNPKYTPQPLWDYPSNALFIFESTEFNPTLLYYDLVKAVLGL